MATIRGYIYQFWWSVDAWLQLESADDVIYLEGAEDLDTVRPGGATTEQVKHEAASISLNNQRAHTALENFWTVSEKDRSRRIDFHYVSTASPALEQDGFFGDATGIDAWRVAQTNATKAAVIRDYLVQKLNPASSLRVFLISASPEEVQSRLFRRFHWFLEQPGVEEVEQSVEDRLTLRLSQKNIHLSYVRRAKDRLYAYVNRAIVQPESSKRRLTAAELLREIDAATTDHVAMPASLREQFVAALHAGAFDPGEALLRHMKLPVPSVPAPLLSRPQVVAEVKKLVEERQAVILTGTVSKGKTTIAELVAIEFCPDAWWFPLSLRSGTETDSLLRALATVIDTESTPSLVVLDDVDLTPASQTAYRHSLALVVTRANRSGRGLILTARGSSIVSAELASFNGIKTVDVPEMSSEEIELHCTANRCPKLVSSTWASLIRSTTGGHPKLVQVRIAELSAANWPMPTAADLLATSAALGTARQFSRQLLSSSVSETTAEFLYTAAEATFPLTRQMLLRLSEAIGGVVNGGDLIDSLVGRWLERVVEDRLRVTSILNGSGAEVWEPERRKLAHRRLYDSIAKGKALDVADAAALLFHAFIAGDGCRLMHCAHMLESIGSQTVSSAVYQQLQWVPYVALLPEQHFFEDSPYVSVLLRQIQFSVASDLDSDSLLSILDRWTEELDHIPEDVPRDAMRVMFSSKVVGSRNEKIPLRIKLGAVDALRQAKGEISDVANEGVRLAINMSRESPGGIPENATVSQFLLSLHASAVRSLDDLTSVLDWLEHDVSADIKLDFEEILSWPVVNSCGAYLHGAWAQRHAETKDWKPTIAILERAAGLARRFNLPRYGSEIAKAISIVYGEYMTDHTNAIRVLDEAAAEFGGNITLQEQRVNALFQVGQDALALDVWEQMLSDPGCSNFLDAFSFRRAGISAARLGRLTDAERYFLAGTSTPPQFQLEITKFGLIADASYVAALAGQPRRAGRMLAEMLLKLPTIAWEDGHESWEAFSRLVLAIQKCIEHVTFGTGSEPKISFGKASEPGLSFGPTQPEQTLRVELAVARAGLLAARLGSVPVEYYARLLTQRESHFPLLRFHSSMGALAIQFHFGTGGDFVNLLASFERAFHSLGALRGKKKGTLRDEGDSEPTELETVEEGWFAVFSAAAICSKDPRESVDLWKNSAAARWGERSQVVKDLTGMASGLNMSAAQARDTVRRRAPSSRGAIFGSALRLLNLEHPVPRTTFSLQYILASATVSHAQGLLLQKTFGRAIARRFVTSWEEFVKSPFLLVSPRTSLPLLTDAIASVKNGRASIRTLLSAAAQAVGTSLGPADDELE